MDNNAKPPKKISKLLPATSGALGNDVVSDLVKGFFKEFYSVVKFCIELLTRKKSKDSKPG
jgi:hypothetical protein